MLYSVLVAIDVILAIGIIGLVLIQQGKGADVGAAFGGGASGTVFGARGSTSFLTRTTAILVALFFINSLALAYLASHRPVTESVINTTEEVDVIPSAESVPEDEVVTELPQEEEEASDLPEAVPSDSNNADVNESDDAETIKESTPDDIPE